MAGAPAPIQRLVAELSKLPGIGEKTALRLAFHVLRAEDGYAASLAEALRAAVEQVRLCSRCCSLTESDPCPLCADPRRDGSQVCVVEGVADLLAVERTREYRGRYHVLHGVLSPLDGVGPEQLRIKELLARVGGAAGGFQEIILATNPDVEGEATALYLSRLLRPLGVRVTRIAQGMPMGGDLEYADQATLARAMSGRREV
ncbi:MAG: recombination mediator RecR [Deltaproteobacteria bacterium]